MFHDQRFYVALAFVLFFVIFGRRLWGVISTHLDAHADQVRHDLDEAARLRRDAEQMLEDATREREQALAEAQALIERSREEAKTFSENARREAEAVAAQREQMARDRIAASERAAIQEVRSQAVDAAVAAVREVLSRQVAEHGETAKALVDRSLEALPAALRAANEAEHGGASAA